MRQLLLLATLIASFILLVTRSMAEARSLGPLDRLRYALVDLQDAEDVAEFLQNLEESRQKTSQNAAYNSYNVKRTSAAGHLQDSSVNRQAQAEQANNHAQKMANDPFGPGRKRQATSFLDLYRLD